MYLCARVWVWVCVGGGGAYSFVACLINSYLGIDQAPFSKRSTVPAPNRDTSNIWALITLLPYTRFLIILSPSCSPFAATIYLLG